MPKSKKPGTAGKKSLLPGKEKPGFPFNQSRIPNTFGKGKGIKGGKPKLFPGRTGSR
ncbi:hypothetical protein N9L47_04980 [Rhodobacteraceae bacterium]|nr:hypothetical protein [Paracoccaceae bacterium]